MTNVKPMFKGEKFGRLTILGESEKRSSGIFEKCLCSCGTIKWISRNHLRMGRSKSCGCLVKEKSKETMTKMNTRHGMFGTHFYRIYRSIYGRCYNPNSASYKNYGGRGIKLLWENFEEFYNDMYESYVEHFNRYGKEDTTIDRINPNLDYYKENCRWATRKEQANNRTNNRPMIYKGKKYNSLSNLVDEQGKDYDLVCERLYYGWDIEDAIEIPCLNKGSNRMVYKLNNTLCNLERNTGKDTHEADKTS